MNDQSATRGLTAFDHPATSPGALSAPVASKVLEAAGDVVLILGAGGMIDDAAITAAGGEARFGNWVGISWIDTVTVESKPKITEMLAAASAGEPARWRQVNHPTEGGDVPVRYLLIGAGPDRFMAIGRDLRDVAAMQQRLLQTQQSLERDYLRLRQTESRYRMLFDLAAEPVLIVDVSAGGRIREANPAAHQMLALKPGTLANRAITTLVAAEDRDALDQFLGDAARADGVTPIDVRLAQDGSEAKVSATLFRQERVTLLMVRLSQDNTAANGETDSEARTRIVIDRMPDAFVLTDGDLAITAANAAFVEMAQAASAERLRGASLATWLGRPGVELDLLVSQMRDHGTIRNVSTIVRGSGGSREEVEVSAVAAPGGEDGNFYGFTIRSVARRIKDVPAVARDLPRSVEQLTELVGRMSLKDIVRESTDLIERLCIEAALAYTSDNRASAAEILGVSRQSLYSKLHRHGLGNLISNPE